MSRQWPVRGARIDGRSLVALGILPGVATILAMGVGFALVSGLLIAWEAAIVGRLWTRALALATMYLLPPFVVGVWMGTRHGRRLLPPIAIGLTPVVALVVSLGAFGGPVAMPFERPLLLLAALVAWSGVAAGGVALGAALLRPRLFERPAPN